jgi:hypothetical protein
VGIGGVKENINILHLAILVFGAREGRGGGGMKEKWK